MPVSLPFWQPGEPAVQLPPGFTAGVFVTVLGTPLDAGGVALEDDGGFDFELELEFEFLLAFALEPDE